MSSVRHPPHASHASLFCMMEGTRRKIQGRRLCGKLGAPFALGPHRILMFGLSGNPVAPGGYPLDCFGACPSPARPTIPSLLEKEGSRDVQFSILKLEQCWQTEWFPYAALGSLASPECWLILSRLLLSPAPLRPPGLAWLVAFRIVDGAKPSPPPPPPGLVCSFLSRLPTPFNLSPLLPGGPSR